MGGFKVVCLISGGKDSVFSALHCLANGHEIVALANLHPTYDENTPQGDDLDSYMYQTIGHRIVPLFEQALGLPLYRQCITGSAINQTKSYDPAAVDADETEALVPLLEKVLANHPEVDAVSTGAILSDYQRTRVESVALRLGLTPLSYLWQYPFLEPFSQSSLLEDMAAVGQDSRIIKVASGGLDDSFLWHDVVKTKTINRLVKASRRFGTTGDGAVLGEGGEYETLAIAGPAPLWKGRIVVEEDQRNIIMGEAGSASLHVLGARVEQIPPTPCPKVHTPALLEPRFENMLARLRAPGDVKRGSHAMSDASSNTQTATSQDAIHTQATDQQLLPNIIGHGHDAAQQMRSIMDSASSHLRSSGNTLSDVVYTSIVLRDMADFSAINKIYGACFTRPNPPARATIACAGVLPADKRVMVSFTFSKSVDNPHKKGLHVQSRSYWAPANIGPYSQAISLPVSSEISAREESLIYVAGQIPLVPSSMELCSGTEAESDDAILAQSVLSLQHASRVGRAMGVTAWTTALAFVVADSSTTTRCYANVARQTWKAFHESDSPHVGDTATVSDDDDSFDVWDLKYGFARNSESLVASASRKTSNDSPIQSAPLLHVARADALPRNASIEWVMFGTSGSPNNVRVPHVEHLLQLFATQIIQTVQE